MSNAGPKGPARKAKATPRGAAQIPLTDSRRAHYKRLAALPDEERFTALCAEMERQRAHADTPARDCIEAALQAAHLDPRLAASPELSRFVWLMRELLHEFIPGETLEEMLRPLHTLLSSADGRQGGRPDEVSRWLKWRELVNAKKARHKTLTAAEIYEDVAAEWNANPANSIIKAKSIRNALSELQKRGL